MLSVKTISVFYDSEGYPFKDAQRTVRYPITSGSFAGSNNTKEIRFYVDRIGGTSGISWVVVSKLPNGKVGYELVNNVQPDSELGEDYLSFDLSAYYTQAKGDLYLALRGYQGEVTFEDDDNDGVYTISGDPLIEVTGTIKLSINYSPMVDTGTQVLPTDLDQIISALSNYLKIKDGIIVTYDITQLSASNYNTRQIFFEYKNDVGKFYYVKLTSGVKSFAEVTFDSIRTGELRVSNYILITNNSRLYYDDDKLKMTVNGHTFALSTTGIVSIDGNSLATQQWTNTNFYTKTESDNKFDIQSYIELSGTSGTLTSEELEKALRPNAIIKISPTGSTNYVLHKSYHGSTRMTFSEPLKMVLVGLNKYRVFEHYLSITISTGAWTLSEYTYDIYDKEGTDNAIQDAIATAMTSALVYQGTKTVAEINALDTSTLKVGYFYNVSDSGTITLGSLEVYAGDNICWTGSGWDKLTMDLSIYDDKFIAAGFFEVQNYNESTGEITFVYSSDLYDMSYDTSTGILTIQAN